MLVFQYGSNCSESEINSPNRLCGDARFVSIAETAEDFELAFDVYSNSRGCAAADIIRKPGGKVWGVVYDIPDYLIGRATAKAHNRKSLDAIEGEGTNYKQEFIDVSLSSGEVVNVLTYTVMHPQPGLTTSLQYVGHIIHGLRAHGIPQNYIDTVKKIAAANNPAIKADIYQL